MDNVQIIRGVRVVFRRPRFEVAKDCIAMFDKLRLNKGQVEEAPALEAPSLFRLPVPVKDEVTESW